MKKHPKGTVREALALLEKDFILYETDWPKMTFDALARRCESYQPAHETPGAFFRLHLGVTYPKGGAVEGVRGLSRV